MPIKKKRGSRKSVKYCNKYANIPLLHNFCIEKYRKNKFKDVNKESPKTDFINLYNFDFSDVYKRIELKDKIFNYLLKNKKDFLKGKKDYTKSEINKEVIYYLDLALQLQLEIENEYLQHLILIYFSSMEKEILLNKDKFRKRVYLDFGYLESDFKGYKFKKRGSLKKVSKNNEWKYIESHKYNNQENNIFKNGIKKFKSMFGGAGGKPTNSTNSTNSYTPESIPKNKNIRKIKRTSSLPNLKKTKKPSLPKRRGSLPNLKKTKKPSLPKRTSSLYKRISSLRNERGSLPNRRGSLPNLKKTKKPSLPKKPYSAPERLSLEEGVYTTSHIDHIIDFFDEYVITYIHMKN